MIYIYTLYTQTHLFALVLWNGGMYLSFHPTSILIMKRKTKFPKSLQTIQVAERFVGLQLTSWMLSFWS